MKAILLGGDTMRLIADSALLRCNKPLFLDDASHWSIKVCPAIKISRLGFHIKEKFAARYYDSASAVGICIPNEWGAAPWTAPEVMMARDNCLIEGAWVTLDERMAGTRLDYSANGLSGSVTLGDLGVDKAIAALSCHMTFKTGDILVFAGHSLDIAAQEAAGEIKTELNGTKCLDFRIK